MGKLKQAIGSTISKAKAGIAKAPKLAKAVSFAGKLAKGAGAIGATVTALSLAEKAAEKLGVRGGAGFIGKRPDSGRKKRRMNPLNIKALRRSTSRLSQFDKAADKVRKELQKLAPRPRMSRASSGVITAKEAASALRR